MSPFTLFIPLYFLGIMIKGKSKKAGAIYDLLWSAGILVWALGVYAEGDSIALFGQIELPPPVFVLILVGVMISEIVTLVQVVSSKPETTLEEERQEQTAMEAAQAQATHMDKPCTLYIVHTSGLIGSAVKIQLSLNGQPVGVMANSSYLVLTTDVVENRLQASCPSVPQGAEIEFQAQSSGEVRVNLELRTGRGIVLSVADSVGYRQRPVGKKRVRKVRVLYVLWSLTNMWAYCLGTFPLLMTLGAAKTPFDDMAERKLRSAKKWNLWMSGLLAVCIAVGITIGLTMR